MRQSNLSLNSILDEEFLTTLAKSADLYKIGSNTILDPEEIRIGLKVVPRAVMAMLISELSPMEINTHKDIHLPFGKSALIRVNKNAADDYTGSVYNDNKLVYDFRNRSIPGLGIIILSTFELYDLEELSGQKSGQSAQIQSSEDIDKKVQKLIDERMELHSLVSKVVEDKIAQREAIHKIIMTKLSKAMKTPIATPPVAIPPVAIPPIATPPVAIPPIAIPPIATPLEVKPSDMTKKESSKKELPLKKFLDRKKKSKEYNVEIAKSETRDCGSCGQTIFGSQQFSGCLCFGPDQNRKIWIKKSDDGIQLKFSKGWDPDNISLLLETLRRSNGKY